MVDVRVSHVDRIRELNRTASSTNATSLAGKYRDVGCLTVLTHSPFRHLGTLHSADSGTLGDVHK